MAGSRGADHHDHHAEERRDHREDRADHAVAGGVGAEEVWDVDRCADRVRREQCRAEDRERHQLPPADPLGAEGIPPAPGEKYDRQRQVEQRRG